MLTNPDFYTIYLLGGKHEQRQIDIEIEPGN